MKALLLGLLFGASIYAQSPSVNFYLDPSNGAIPTSQLTPLPDTYQFSDTPVGGSTPVVIRVANPSTTASVEVNTVFVGASANSSVATPNFTITGMDINATIAPGA